MRVAAKKTRKTHLGTRPAAGGARFAWKAADKSPAEAGLFQD
jgi:hypothetical protein